MDVGNPVLAPSRPASARSTRSEIETVSVNGANCTAADEKKQQATATDQEDTAPSSDSDIGGDEEQAATAPSQDDRPQFSNLRLLSLVLTVTGAAFLNVSRDLPDAVIWLQI